MASAGIAFTIMLASSLGPGKDFVDTFVVRFVMIFLASVYVTGAMKFLESYAFGHRSGSH